MARRYQSRSLILRIGVEADLDCRRAQSELPRGWEPYSRLTPARYDSAHRTTYLHRRAGRVREDRGVGPAGGGAVSAEPVRGNPGGGADGPAWRPVPPAAAGHVRRRARPAGGDPARGGPQDLHRACHRLDRRRARVARQHRAPADRLRRRRALRAARRGGRAADAVGGGGGAAGRGRPRGAVHGGGQGYRRPAARGDRGDLRRLSRRPGGAPVARPDGAAGRGRGCRGRVRAALPGGRRRLPVLPRRRVAHARCARPRPRPVAGVRSRRG